MPKRLLDAKLFAVELVPPVVSLVPKLALDAKLFAVVMSGIVSVAGMEPGDRCGLLVCLRPDDKNDPANDVVFIGIVSVVGIEACDRCGLLAGCRSFTGDWIVVRGLVTVFSDDVVVVIGPSLPSAVGCCGTVP